MLQARGGNAIYNSDDGNIIVSGGTLDNITTDPNARTIYNNGAGNVNISNGVISSNVGTAIFNSNTGNITVSGGTVCATTGCAIYNDGKGLVTISEANSSVPTIITSANSDTELGTICIPYDSQITGAFTVFQMTGGTVSNTAKSNNARAIANDGLANISVAGGRVLIDYEGAYLTDTTTHYSGNAIYNYLYGCVTISGGEIKATSGNAVRNDGNGNLTIYGGTISSKSACAVANLSFGNLYLYGAPSITGGTSGDVECGKIGYFYANNGATSDAVYYTGSGVIDVYQSSGLANNVIIVDGVTAANYDEFTLTNAETGYGIRHDGGDLKYVQYHSHTVGAITTYFEKVLGYGATYITIDGIEQSSNTLPAGNYVLAAGFTAKSDLTISGTVNICLNGFTLNMGTNKISVGSGATLNIYDCSSTAEGKITGANATSTEGIIFLKEDGSINLYKGTVENTAENDYANVIYNKGDGDIEIKGGTVQINYPGAYTTATTHYEGTAIFNNNTGNVTVSGGTVKVTIGYAILNDSTGNVTISDGMVSATEGCAIANGDEGNVTISGGTVSSGSITAVLSNGGSISISGTDTVIRSNGVGEDDGSATIYLFGGSLVMTGGTVENTAASDVARVIYNIGVDDIEIKGGTVQINYPGAYTTATTHYEGTAIFNSNTGNVTVSGGTVKVTEGKAIYNHSTGNVTVSNGTVSAIEGYAIINNSTGIVSVSGGSISAAIGLAIFNVDAGKIYLSNTPSITGGTGTDSDIYLEKAGALVANNGATSSPVAYSGDSISIHKNTPATTDAAMVSGVTAANGGKFTLTNAATGHGLCYDSANGNLVYNQIAATVTFDTNGATDDGVETLNFATFEEAWNYAAGLGSTADYRVTVKLLQNVTAQDHATVTKSFGTGIGFGDGMSAGTGYIRVSSGDYITLDLNGKTLSRALSTAIDDGQVIRVAENGNLTITDTSSSKNGTITGGNNLTGDGGGGMLVNGVVTLQNGNISGNKTENTIATAKGGGVYLSGSAAVFTMTGGSISNNYAKIMGGGVYIGANAHFDLSGGKIFNNSCGNGVGGGGIAVFLNSSLVMTGGEIFGNSADYVGGILANGSLTLGGTAKIYGNTMLYHQGGGVFVNDGATFYLSGGVEITDNVRGGSKADGAMVYTGGTANNLYLNSGAIINISDNDDTTTSDVFTGEIGVSATPSSGSPKILTSGWTSSCTGTLTADATDCRIRTNASGETTLNLTYTIIYKPGDYGTESETTATKIDSESITLAGVTFTRTGYTQTGWAITDGAITNTYALSTSYTDNAALTLYPVWTANTTTITLQGYNGDTDSVTATYDSALPAFTALERAGYTLTGYYTDTSDGTKIINANGALVVSVTDYTDATGKWKYTGATLTLKTEWTANDYDVTATLTHVGSTGTTGTDAATAGVDYTLTLNKLAGYDLPYSVTVTVGENTLTSSDYSYDIYSGEITIDGSKIINDISITAIATAGNYYWTDEFASDGTTRIRATSFGEGQLDTENKKLSIKTAAELGLFAYNLLLSDGFAYEDYTITIDGDIDLSKYFWTPVPIMDSESEIYTVFDGKGHTIRGVKIDGKSSIQIEGDRVISSGFFALMSLITVQNLYLDGAVTANDNNGGFAGLLAGVASNVDVLNSGFNTSVTVSSDSDVTVGGVVGNGLWLIFANSYVKGSISVEVSNDVRIYVAGVCGYMSSVINSYSTVNLTLSGNYSSSSEIGTLDSYGTTARNSHYISTTGIAYTKVTGAAMSAADMQKTGSGSLEYLLNDWIVNDPDNFIANNEWSFKHWAVGSTVNGGYPTFGYSIAYLKPDGSAIILPASYDNARIFDGVAAFTLPTAEPYAVVGYEFVGWYTAKTEGTKVTAIAAGTTANQTVYARYTALKYNINYKDKGDTAFSGTHGTNYPTKHTYDVATPLVAPTKTGYTFGGWFENSDCTGTAVTSIGATAKTENFTLYALWTIERYTYKFDSNGGTPVADLTKNYGESLSAPGAPTKDGYTFSGWYETESNNNGSGTVFSFATTMPDFGENNATKTLYAGWTLKAPVITLPEGYSGEYNGSNGYISITATHALSGITYQWYKGTTLIKNANSRTFAVIDVVDSGTYYCTATITDGTQTNSETSDEITVEITPKEVDIVWATDDGTLIFGTGGQAVVFKQGVKTDFCDEIKPYYDVDGGKIYPEYTVKKGGSDVTVIDSAGKYDITISASSPNYCYDTETDDRTIEVRQSSISDDGVIVTADIGFFSDVSMEVTLLTAGGKITNTVFDGKKKIDVVFKKGGSALDTGSNLTALGESASGGVAVKVLLGTIDKYYVVENGIYKPIYNNLVAIYQKADKTYEECTVVLTKDATNAYGEFTATHFSTYEIANKLTQYTKPSSSGTTYTYTGELQTETPQNYVATAMSISGNTSTRAQKDMTITIELLDTVNTEWAGDRSNGAVTYKWSVLQKVIGLNWAGIPDLVYSGLAKTTTATATGLCGIDACNVTVGLTPGCDNVNAGTFTYIASQLDNDDYKLPVNVYSGEFVITSKVLEVVWKGEDDSTTDFSWVYTGKEIKPSATVSTGVGTEKVALTITGGKTDVSASNYSATASKTVVNDNYSLTNTTHTFSITKASLTITAKDHTITYGDDNSNNGVTYDGFVNNETAAVLGDTLIYSYTYAQFGDVGTSYTITPSGLTSGNYAITFVAGKMTVGAKNITVSITPNGGTYGNVTAATADLNGLVNNDIVPCTLTYTATNYNSIRTPSAAGNYVVSATISDTNYKLTGTVAAAFTIGKATVSVPADAGSKTYTGATLTSDIDETGDYEITINEGGKNVGKYDVVITLKDNANKKWASGEDTATRTIDFSITQAANSFLTAVALAGWTYGETANTPTSTAKFGKAGYSYSTAENGEYSSDVPTNVGAYWIKASVAETNDYTAAESKISFAIAKATAVITVDTTDIVVVYDDVWSLPEATSNFGTVERDLDEKDIVNVNTYTVVYSVAETGNYYGDSKQLSVTVNKLAVAKPAADDTVYIADGNPKSYVIAANGRYTVSGNKMTEVGNYTVTVQLNDKNNCEWADGTTKDLTFDFVIRKAQLTEKLEDEQKEDSIIVTTPDGFAPDATVEITIVPATSANYGSELKKNEKISAAYDVKLFIDGKEEEPSDDMTLRLLIPTECVGKDFRLLHVQGTEVTEMQYSIEGDYAVISTDKLQGFAFVVDNTGSIVWVIILLIAILLAEIALAAVKLRKNKNGKKTVKTYSIAPLLLAVFIPAGQTAAAAVLGALCVIGCFYNVYLYLLKDRTGKKEDENELAKTVVETNEVAAQPAPARLEATDEEIVTDYEDIDVDEEEGETSILVRYRKSFMAKLIQSDDETKNHYGEIKNAILSYKKTTSRISWDHESVTSGRNKLAKFSIRGKTLCLYLALNPDDYADSKYKVERAEGKKYDDTPCLYRIKNARRAAYAVDLIEAVAAKFGLIKGEEQSVDYSLPYESTSALIAKGLIKELITQEQFEDAMRHQEKSSTNRQRRVFVSANDAAAMMRDDEARALVVEKAKEIAIEKKEKEIVNVDSISENFSAGEVVNLQSLQEKNLIGKNVNYLKILARGNLDKPLIVEANEFSIDAIKMILLVGGTVIRII